MKLKPKPHIEGKTGVIVFIPFCLIVIVLTIYFVSQATKQKEIIESSQDETSANELVRPSLVAGVKKVKPGESFTAGMMLEMVPQWHVYWQNPGDSGMATEINWQGPPGSRIKPLEFPIPKRFVQPGDIIGYGYEDQVMFLAEVQIPESFAPGSDFKLRAQVSWLACKERCVPGAATVEIKLPVDATTQPDQDNRALIESWRKKVPVRAERENLPFTYTVQDGIEPDRRTGSMTINCTWRSDVHNVTCLPFSSDVVLLKNLTCRTTKNQTAIELNYSLMGQLNAMKTPPKLLITYDKDKTRQAVILPLIHITPGEKL